MKHIFFYLLLLLSTCCLSAQNYMHPQPAEGEQIVHHTAYSLSYNFLHNQPSWVAYSLTRDHAVASLPRKNSFKADTAVTGGSADPADYARSGYDKGHLAPNADMNWDPVVQQECFLMSNMSPQTHAFNAGLWKRAETQVRNWAIEYDSIYIVTGPVFTTGTILQCDTWIHCDIAGRCDTVSDCITLIETPSNLKTIGHQHSVSVPEYFYKIVYNPSTFQAIAFLIPHENKKGSLTNWVVTVDIVEQITGLDFFSALDNSLEEQIESNVCIPCWNWDN